MEVNAILFPQNLQNKIKHNIAGAGSIISKEIQLIGEASVSIIFVLSTMKSNPPPSLS